MMKTLFATVLATISPNLPDPDPNAKQLATTSEVHPAPPGVDYATNDTPFGAILRGELPARSYAETKCLYAFRDRTARAPLHALIIPKQRVDSVFDLKGGGITNNQNQIIDSSDVCFQNDVELITSMKEMAFEILKKEQLEAFEKNDYILCFHIPPFYSVSHLHMHVLAPASQMSPLMRDGKYRLGTRWCVGVDYILSRLKDGKASLPPGYPFFK